MPFDLHELIADSMGGAQSLHEAHVNPMLSRVLGMIGFAHEYTAGTGCYLTTVDGREIFDALSGYGVFGMGRNHPAIRDALKQALDANLPNLVQMDCSLLSGLLAKQLISLAPTGRLKHVFFANSGTEAIEGAIKFARGATNRPRILFSKGAFHGLSTGSLALNGDDSFREGFGDLLPGCEKVDMEDIDSLARQLKTNTVAAVIVEPIRGKGVFFPKDQTIYPTIQRLCKETNTLFVIDEIQSGLGRTGKWWACQHWNLEPDMMMTAKALSGGYIPVGAILYSEEIYKNVFSKLDRCVVHSSTFGQNSMAMVAGLATLQLIKDEKLIEQAAQRGEQLLNGFKHLQEKHEFIKDVRGKGLMIGIEFGSPRSLRLKPAWSLLHSAQNGLFAQAVVMQLYEKHHILTQVAGHLQEVVKLLPPLIMNEAEGEYLLSAFDDVLSECRRFPGPVWSVGKQLVTAAAKQHFSHYEKRNVS